MWKFPATLLTWRYPCIRQAFRGWVGSSSLQIEWKTYTPLEMTALYLSMWRNTFPYRCHVFWPWWESSGGTFHDILKQNILEWMFLTQMVLNEQKCPEGHKTQIYIYPWDLYKITFKLCPNVTRSTLKVENVSAINKWNVIYLCQSLCWGERSKTTCQRDLKHVTTPL